MIDETTKLSPEQSSLKKKWEDLFCNNKQVIKKWHDAFEVPLYSEDYNFAHWIALGNLTINQVSGPESWKKISSKKKIELRKKFETHNKRKSSLKIEIKPIKNVSSKSSVFGAISSSPNKITLGRESSSSRNPSSTAFHRKHGSSDSYFPKLCTEESKKAEKEAQERLEKANQFLESQNEQKQQLLDNANEEIKWFNLKDSIEAETELIKLEDQQHWDQKIKTLSNEKLPATRTIQHLQDIRQTMKDRLSWEQSLSPLRIMSPPLDVINYSEEVRRKILENKQFLQVPTTSRSLSSFSMLSMSSYDGDETEGLIESNKRLVNERNKLKEKDELSQLELIKLESLDNLINDNNLRIIEISEKNQEKFIGSSKITSNRKVNNYNISNVEERERERERERGMYDKQRAWNKRFFRSNQPLKIINVELVNDRVEWYGKSSWLLWKNCAIIQRFTWKKQWWT